MEIIEKYGLYVDERRRKTTEEILSRMRSDMQVQSIQADVIDPRSGRPTQATIAFVLSFEGRHPSLTQKVANELTSLYLNENIKTRTEKATETLTFLTSEADRLSERIAGFDEKLARFKEKNVNTLPELRSLNMSLMERTETEITSKDNQLGLLEDRKFYLEGQLALINPQIPTILAGGEVVMGLEARLKALRNQYISATARYAPDHPDILKLRREIEGLEQHVNIADQSDELKKTLAQSQSRLASAQEKYSDEHPDVISIKRKISIIEDELKGIRDANVTAEMVAPKPDNPAYITLQANLYAVNNQLKSNKTERKQLQAKLAEYEQRIFQSPQVERDFLALIREQQTTALRYREIKAKQMQAEVGQELEKERKGERFTLIDPAQLPEEPIEPNRLAIVFIGLVFSLAGGIGYSAVAEALDNSIRGVKEIIAVLSVAPMSVIPYK